MPSCSDWAPEILRHSYLDHPPAENADHAGTAHQRFAVLVLVAVQEQARLILPAAVQTAEAEAPEFNGSQMHVDDRRRERGVSIVVALDRQHGQRKSSISANTSSFIAVNFPPRP